MTITARYPSRCASCGHSIRVGDTIEWSRGRAARHATCSATKRAAKPRTPRRPSRARPAGPCLVRRQGADVFSRGDIVAAQLSDAEIAALEESQSLTAIDLPPLPGAKAIAAGRRLVACRVIWCTSLDEDTIEDMDAWGEAHQAVVALATAAEAAPAVAARVARRAVEEVAP